MRCQHDIAHACCFQQLSPNLRAIFLAQELERKFQLDGKVDLEMLGVKDNTR